MSNDQTPKPGHFLPGGAGDQASKPGQSLPGDQAPMPGHFLPGGAGDQATPTPPVADSEVAAARFGTPPADLSGDGTTASGVTSPGTAALGTASPGATAPETTSPGASRPGASGPGASGPGATAPGATAPGLTPLAAPTPRLGADAPAGPPQLHGSRIGPPPPGDAAVAAFNARYRPEPTPFVPKKRSKLLIAGGVAGALVLVAGIAFGGMKLLASYDDYVANPVGKPSVRGTDEPVNVKPSGEATSDSAVTAQNKLYTTGKLKPVGCKEPAYQPTTKENVRAYYDALLGCLNKAWEPVVRAAGYEFKAPKLVIFDQGQETACGVHDDTLDTYCPDGDGVLAMAWEDWPEDYQNNRPLARVDLANNLGYIYGLHVQWLTGIYTAAGSMGDTAPTESAKLELDRRQALQASCLSAAFLGTEKSTFPLRGELLKEYQWRTAHSGDEGSKTKVRDHGSRKSTADWMTRGFSTGNPGACNTFTAPPAKVS
ncbi:neutral zinc metallopeptidase [Kribbella sp. NPDC051770]|uniref:neutral zinc metallopeptidase n=1 Tax=Kribbella sp. NPDC051770 TaxID=3155413 RepID=UPI00343AAAC9